MRKSHYHTNLGINNYSLQPRSEKKGRDFWGEHWWVTIHTAAAAYTPDKAYEFKNMIYYLFQNIPCEECRMHALDNLKKYPLEQYLNNNHDTFYWSYLFHDTVNQQWNSRNPDKQQKKSPNYDYIKSYYFNALKGDCKACSL